MELDKQQQDQMIRELQAFLDEELKVEMGQFDVQFLLEFFGRKMGCHYYNQGLADALNACKAKMDECADLVYELETLPD